MILTETDFLPIHQITVRSIETRSTEGVDTSTSLYYITSVVKKYTRLQGVVK